MPSAGESVRQAAPAADRSSGLPGWLDVLGRLCAGIVFAGALYLLVVAWPIAAWAIAELVAWGLS